MAPLDDLMQQIGELTSVVREHNQQNDRSTIDIQALAKELRALNETLIQRQPTPSDPIVRRGEEIEVYQNQPVGPVEEGRFRGMDPLDLVLSHRLLEVQQAHKVGKGPSHDLSRAAQRAVQTLNAAVGVTKLMTDTGAGTGAELAPTAVGNQLWDDIHAATLIGNLIPTQPMPSDPFKNPLGIGDMTFRKGTQGTATTATDMSTAEITYTATELVGEADWSYNLDEEAVIAVMPGLREVAVRNASEYIDKFLLNADSTNAATGNINLDDADPADDSYYLSLGQDGFRHLWLVDNTAQGVNAGGDALTDADMRALFVKLDKYFQDAQSGVCVIPDYTTYLSGMLGLGNVVTVDKMGPNATVLRGQLGSYMGVPIVPSAFHPLGEADGKVSTTAGNNTLGSMSALNRAMWRKGFVRDVTVEIDRNIQTRVWILVVSFRMAVVAHGTRSTTKHTAGIRNILV